MSRLIRYAAVAAADSSIESVVFGGVSIGSIVTVGVASLSVMVTVALAGEPTAYDEDDEEELLVSCKTTV